MARRADEAVDNDTTSLSPSDYSQPNPLPAFSNLSISGSHDPPNQDIADIPRQTSISTSTALLETGQLIKDEWFTLFESVGALEIMDKKMDSGFLEQDETLDDDYDVRQIISLEQLLGVIDQLLCHEIAWTMGHPLSQTLFTSIYLDNLLSSSPRNLSDVTFQRSMPPISGTTKENVLVDVVLRAYCICLIKTCDVVHSMIVSQYFQEEEDFVSHLYNRELLPWLSIAECKELLAEAENTLFQMKGKNKKGSKKARVIQTRDAILCRLQLRHVFLDAVNLEWDDFPEVSVRSFESCQSLIPTILSTTELGSPVPRSFSTKVQRKLASTVPPRPMVNIEFDKAMAYFAQVCRDGRDVLRNLDFEGATSLLNSVVHFMSRRPQPSVFIRTFLQFILFEELPRRSVVTVRDLILDELEEIVMPGGILLDPRNEEVELPTDPRFNIANMVDRFIQLISNSYVETYRCLCQNRSRTRRALAHSIEEWNLIGSKALEFDSVLEQLVSQLPAQTLAETRNPSKPLAAWASYHRTRQISLVCLLGFELDIYAIDELAGMYYYLMQTTEPQISLLNRLQAAISGDSAPPVVPENAAATRRSVIFYHLEILKSEAQFGFSFGLSSLYTLLSRLSLLPTISRPYSTPSLRYDVRMRPFSRSYSTFPSYTEFTTHVSQAELSNAALVDRAASSIRHAKENYELLNKMGPEFTRTTLCFDEWKADLKKSLHACVAAGVAVAMIRKIVDEGKTERWKVEMPPPVGEGVLPKGVYHEWWIVPKVVAG